MRLTVGRRLAIIVALAILTLITIVVLLLRSQAFAAKDRAQAQLKDTVAPVALLIEGELSAASTALEVAAATAVDDEQIVAVVEDAGFIAAEVLDGPDAPSVLEATTNLLDRSVAETSFGATSSINGTVGLIIGTPIAGSANENSTAGPGPGRLLVGAYDASKILDAVAVAQSGKSGELLLAARNAAGDVIIFTPSRHGGDEPVGQPDRVTSTLIDRVLNGEGELDRFDQTINGRRAAVYMQRVPGAEWVVLATIDVADTGVATIPFWLVPAFLGVAALMLVPIARLRTRLRRVTTCLLYTSDAADD